MIATDPGIAAPSMLGEGRLFDDHATWPYLVTRVSGLASWPNEPSARQRPSIVEDLGLQVRRMHALTPHGVATDADSRDTDVVAAAERSSLPPHLLAGRELPRPARTVDNVFDQGDLAAKHVFVQHGLLSGSIAW